MSRTTRVGHHSRRRSAALALATIATTAAVAACGETFVDEAAPDPAVSTTTTSAPPVDPDAPLPDLLGEIERLMVDLDELIIDDDVAARARYERIDEFWTVAERQIRRADPDDVYNFEQAIELARTGAERRRPADASKGSKILDDVLDAYLDR